MTRRLFPLLLVAAVFAAAMVAGPAMARKPAASSEACSTPTLSGPASVAVGASYTIDGCGFAPNTMVPIEITAADGCCMAMNMVSDSTGRFTYHGEADRAGGYRIRAAVLRHDRWVVAAEWSFTAS